MKCYSVISFFAFLNSNPKGRNLVRVCQTISCDMHEQKLELFKLLNVSLELKIGETTKDNKYYC
ncbi:MAG: NAD(P)H-dependent oxidoreductase subunit E [Ignavibacteriales bacterium]|nr:NAD(P)H-dependent oxidoreductase subunit E [Ignavibacteriales bacterium]